MTGWLVASLAMLLVVTLTPSPTWSAGSGPSGETAPEPLLVAGSGAEQAAADIDTAVAAAAHLNERVEVLAKTTERSRHLANPNGSITFESYLVPQRVRRGGEWVPVDTDLGLADGRVVPGATVLDVSLSSGGTDELVTLTDGDRRLGLSWPAPLPEPELSGDTARYRDVLPGVDLVVRVDEESFSQVLVVRSRAAAAHPALARIAWDVTTADGLTLVVSEDGGVEARDELTGEVVFAAPPSTMWDSPPPADPEQLMLARRMGESLHLGEMQGAPGRVELMPAELVAGELAVVPDRGMLTDPATRFPIRIDPSFGKGVRNWSPVLRARPTESWSSGTAQPRDYIRVGRLVNWPNQPCGAWCGVWRSHLRFNVSEMAGETLIGNPTFRIRLVHSASCGNTPVALWRTNSIGSGNVTWNDMKDKWLVGFGTRSASANSGCSSQNEMNVEWSTSAMRNSLQGRLNAGTTNYAYGLRAGTQSDEFQWKRFDRTSPRLVATYNRKPRQPDRLGVSGDCYLACSSPAVVRTLRPTLQARVRDHHGAQLNEVRFELRNGAGSLVASGTDNNVNSGGTATWRPGPDLTQEGSYRFRVRARNQHLWSNWSDNFHFTVDTNPPDQPVVSSERYRHKDTGSWNGGVGQAGEFSFDPDGSTDVIEYRYRWLDGDETAVSVDKGEAGVATIAPPGDLEQVLQVRSVDHAGNVSGWRSYPFLVRPQPTDVAYWKFDEAAGTQTFPTTGDVAYAGTLHGGSSWVPSAINPADPGASGTAVSLDGGSGYVEVPRVLATDHAAGFTVTAWAKPSDLTGRHVVTSLNGVDQAMASVLYDPDANGGSGGWCFRVHHDDSGSSATTSACSSRAPELDVWTHLAGGYEPATGTIRLWVNGGPNNGEPVPGTVDEAPAPEPWVAAAGFFTVGRAHGGEFWSGLIDEVRAHQRVLTEFEVQHTFLQCRYASCPEVEPSDEPTLVGAWDINEGTGLTAEDESGLGNDLTLRSTAAWTTDGYDGTSALSLDGESGYAETDGPVLLTDQSFTVSVWARLADASGTHGDLVAQSGDYMSPFRLYYSASRGQWRFLMRNVDEAGATSASDVTGIFGPAVEVGRWTQLTGAYDANARVMAFYVDGQLVAEAAHDLTWSATGPLTLGRHLHTLSSDDGVPTYRHYFPGTIDMVRVYQDALTGAQVAALYNEQARSPALVGQWNMDEGSGAVATDTSGMGSHASLSGGAAWTTDGYDGSQAVSLDGGSGYLATDGPVLLTDQSFTVSVWARPAATSASSGNLIAQGGDYMSAFRLYYSGPTGRWRFLMRVADEPGTSGSGLATGIYGSTADAGRWAHLVGVFDAPAGRMSFYIDGQLVGEAAFESAWSAAGPLMLGRLLHTLSSDDGIPTYRDYFDGTIDLVQAYQDPLTGAQVAQLHMEQVEAPELVGRWGLDDGTGSQAGDASGHGNHATLLGGAAWTSDGRNGTAVTFDGASGHVETEDPVLVTDQSFAVAAWARLGDRDGWHTVLSQSGEYRSSIRLDYNATRDQWCAGMWTADAPPGSTVQNWACGGPTPQVGVWTHLVAVYDEVTAELRLYVNGQLAGAVSHSTPWHGDGPFGIGRNWHSPGVGGPPELRDWFAGEVDDVRAYQAALTDGQVWALYSGAEPSG